MCCGSQPPGEQLVSPSKAPKVKHGHVALDIPKRVTPVLYTCFSVEPYGPLESLGTMFFLVIKVIS